MSGGALRHAARGLLPWPGRVLGVATAALLLTLPVLDATRRTGWRADLRTVTTASVVVAAVGAFLLAARYGARRPADRLSVRLAVGLSGTGLLAAGYLAAAQLFHRLVVPVAVDGALHALPWRGLTLALLAGAFGVALGALWRQPAVLALLLAVLALAELSSRWSGVRLGPFSAAPAWLFGVGQPHDVPGCVSVVPAECVTWTYRYWPAGLVLAGGVLVAVLAAAGSAALRPGGVGGPVVATGLAVDGGPGGDGGPAGRAEHQAHDAAGGPAAGRVVPGRRWYACAVGLIVAGLALAPVVIGTGALHATGDIAEGIGTSATVGSAAELPMADAGRLAVFAVGPTEVRDCHAVSLDGTRVDLSPVLGTVRYGDSVSYRWVGTFRVPTPGRWTVACSGEQGEYLVAGSPQVDGLVGRLVEAPRPAGWLLGALPGLLVGAYSVVARHPCGQCRRSRAQVGDGRRR
ncbi:hypothetical protein [Micromonospora sp. NPDC005367]|uniref:hypothetical protein n=1 Tax=Micromonospora sp. NPDC005367 TaxID=3155590 RepID=UPI0033A94066